MEEEYSTEPKSARYERAYEILEEMSRVANEVAKDPELPDLIIRAQIERGSIRSERLLQEFDI